MQSLRHFRIFPFNQPDALVIPFRRSPDIFWLGQDQNNLITAQFKSPVNRNRIRYAAIKVLFSVNFLWVTEKRKCAGCLDYFIVILMQIIQCKINRLSCYGICRNDIDNPLVLGQSRIIQWALPFASRQGVIHIIQIEKAMSDKEIPDAHIALAERIFIEKLIISASLIR